MTFRQSYNSDGISFPPIPPKGGTGSGTKSGSNPGVSPGLITSTGGITGASSVLLAPVTDAITNNTYFTIWDSNIFDTEEDCIYYFPQENIKVNYDVSAYKMILMYRNIGKCTVTFNLSCFRKGQTTQNSNGSYTIKQGTYKVVSKTMILGTNPPDNLLYTVDINIINPGQRPQIWIKRPANKGPFSLISLGLYGNADEVEKL